MNPQLRTKISKRLSLVLRHKPETIGLQLTPQGWAKVTELLHCLSEHNLPVSHEELAEVVATNEKQRFRFSGDGEYICANQGHSISVDLDLCASEPPEILYHGTAERFLESIFTEGLTKQQRHHVHLTLDIDMTLNVASRRGNPILLGIKAAEMARDGYLFYQTQNQVWLTDHVPVQYLFRPSPSKEHSTQP